MGFYSTRRNLFESKAAANTLSEIAWVGDAREISLQLDGATQHIIGSNAEGRSSAIGATSWSTLTTMVPSNAMLNIEPGFRWLRVYRSGSTGTAILQMQQLV